jgi:hypothetical protein
MPVMLWLKVARIPQVMGRRPFRLDVLKQKEIDDGGLYLAKGDGSTIWHFLSECES